MSTKEISYLLHLIATGLLLGIGIFYFFFEDNLFITFYVLIGGLITAAIAWQIKQQLDQED